ncbi:MAG: hypothetical protein IT324_19175 [Anaerolineae bacterium]|nr:hypothetical protein [Anaerolineae bacterium]
MTQIPLSIYTDPGEAEVLCNLLRQDGNLEKIAATVDTGTAVSLFPVELLNTVAHCLAAQHNIVIDQAGIATNFSRRQKHS